MRQLRKWLSIRKIYSNLSMTSSAMSSDTADTLLNVHRYRASERAVRAEKQKSNVRRASFSDWSWIEIYRKQMDHFVRNDAFATADVAPAEASERTANAIDRIWEYVAIALHCRRDDLDNTLTDDRGFFQISEIRDSSRRRVIPAPWWLKCASLLILKLILGRVLSDADWHDGRALVGWTQAPRRHFAATRVSADAVRVFAAKHQ